MLFIFVKFQTLARSAKELVANELIHLVMDIIEREREYRLFDTKHGRLSKEASEE